MTIREPAETDAQGWWDAHITIRARVRKHPTQRGRLQADMNDGKGNGYSLADLPTNYPDIDIAPASLVVDAGEAPARVLRVLGSVPYVIDPDDDNEATGQGDVADDGDRSDPWDDEASDAASASTNGTSTPPSTSDGTDSTSATGAGESSSTPEPEPKDKRPTQGKTTADTLHAAQKPADPEGTVYQVSEEEASAGVPDLQKQDGRTHAFRTPQGPVDCLCDLGRDHGDPTT